MPWPNLTEVVPAHVRPFDPPFDPLEEDPDTLNTTHGSMMAARMESGIVLKNLREMQWGRKS